ncbi:hypothetical protein [Streptomyces sp. GS7]|uniref:hypothetical protein n=1 Tax=Streptomyces sp. GS7 TaxID=2692234 RepID=UPI001316EDA5|nr:hypothetical protein [Streptomyces sp. GS7]QHC22870.1 hypothetical protein GR130_16970 [Streptomyces sp. GS7]
MTSDRDRDAVLVDEGDTTGAPTAPPPSTTKAKLAQLDEKGHHPLRTAATDDPAAGL